jgi:hypothetical protein
MAPAYRWGPTYSQERKTMTTTKTLIDDTILKAMLEQTQYAGVPQEEEYWFSRGNQKKMVFEIGAKLIVATEDLTAKEAITLAQDYVNTFYDDVLSPQGWKKD